MHYYLTVLLVVSGLVVGLLAIAAGLVHGDVKVGALGVGLVAGAGGAFYLYSLMARDSA